MIKTHISRVINAPIQQVWQTIRPFDSLSVWHPYVAECSIEQGMCSDQLGCIRAIHLQDNGGTVRETLLALSDIDHSITYDIIESPMPVTNYIAQIQLHEITESQTTFAHWCVECKTPDNQQQAMTETLDDIFRSGLVKLDQILS